MNFSSAVNEVNEVSNGTAQLKPTIDATGTKLLGTPCLLETIEFKPTDKSGNTLPFPNMEISFKGTDPANDGVLKQIIWGNTFDKSNDRYSAPKEAFATKLLIQFLQAYIPAEEFQKAALQVDALEKAGKVQYVAVLEAFFKAGVFKLADAKQVETELAIVLAYNEKGFEILSNKFKKSFNTVFTPNILEIKIDGKYIKVVPETPDEEEDTSNDINLPDAPELPSADGDDSLPF